MIRWLGISQPFGWPVYASAAGLGVALMGRGLFHPRSQMFGPLVWRVDASDSNSIALTFDDGPHPDGTPAVLDRLAEMNAKATFFVIGQYVKRWPDLVRRMADEGHQVENHSYDHSHVGMFRGESYWRDQLNRTNDEIEKITSIRPQCFRPPMGFKHHPMYRAVRAEGLTMVTWTHRGRDGVATTADRILHRLLRHAGSGDILVLHDGIDPNRTRKTQPTLDAVGPFIQKMMDRGLQPVRLDQMLKASSGNNRIDHL